MNKLKTSPDSDTTTGGIRIQAAAQYLPDDSDPDEPLFLFAYRIVMTNVGERTVQLRSRHWVIRDAFNEREDVKGPGVVGENPVLEPGGTFEYTSSCPLRTSWGTMEGSYVFEDRNTDEQVEVEIGRFFLVPSAVGFRS